MNERIQAVVAGICFVMGLLMIIRNSQQAQREARKYLQFLNTDGWCTVEVVSLFMRFGPFEEDVPPTDIGTVTRNLKLLVRMGLVQQLEMSTTQQEKLEGLGSTILKYKRKDFG